MNKKNKKVSVDLPEEKRKSPLGKRPDSKFPFVSNFASDEQNETLMITNVSAGRYSHKLLSSELNDKGCDATGDDSSNTAWHIKIFLN